jgi:hypothetical protein
VMHSVFGSGEIRNKGAGVRDQRWSVLVVVTPDVFGAECLPAQAFVPSWPPFPYMTHQRR